jgi:T4 RnlA family RNA ligase
MLELFENLMLLCEGEDSPFSFKDHEFGGDTFRIFNYRIASYTDFCKPDALECRGIMFKLQDGKPVRIACRPPKKFFNLNENPFTMNLDHDKIVEFMVKADGSLISSFLWGDKYNLGLKSKAALASEQAVWAMEYLNRPENEAFKDEIHELTIKGWTVNMEYVAPENRVVLPYQKPELLVLNIRNNETGLTLFHNQVYGCPGLNWVRSKQVDDKEKAKEFVKEIPSMVDIEGFVIRYDDGLLVKVKTEWYLHLHLTKDSIVIPRRLFGCVIAETTDDLRSLFSNDEWALKTIKAMEDRVKPQFNHMVQTVESYYSTNKDLVRKDYAIKGQKELGPYFSLAMDKYLVERGLRSSGPDYKEYAIKNYKTFGIKDEELVRDE